MKIQLDPWNRLERREPPVWYRRRLLAALIEVHDCWRQTLESAGEPFYLRLWLFHPEFSRSQVVAALRERIAWYQDVFPATSDGSPAPPPEYGDAAYDLAVFRWTPCEDVGVLSARHDADGEEDIRAWTRAATRVERASNGDTLFIFRRGRVWVGEAGPESAARG